MHVGQLLRAHEFDGGFSHVQSEAGISWHDTRRLGSWRCCSIVGSKAGSDLGDLTAALLAGEVDLAGHAARAFAVDVEALKVVCSLKHGLGWIDV